MENALPRRTAGIPRTWSLCMTSENHGTVGKAGDPFSHAPGKHERVLVVEVPAAAGAPVDQVNLQLVGAHRRRPVAEFKGYVDGEPAVTWLDRDNMPRVGTKMFAEPVAAQAGYVAVPEGWKLVPVEPTLDMVTSGFESVPDEFFSPGEDWDTYAAMTGCQKAAHRARLCYAAMLAAAPAAPAQAAPLPVQAAPAPAPAERIECWSHNEDDFSAKSLGELIDTHELQPGATVWAGEAVHPEPSSLFSTDWVIENMGEAAYDIAGEHGGEDYPNVSDEQVAELEALVVGWITKCAPPTFWTVKNVRPYVLTAEDCGDQASTSGERQEGGAA